MSRSERGGQEVNQFRQRLVAPCLISLGLAMRALS